MVNGKRPEKGKFDYDFTEDVIYIYPKKRTYASSIQIGNMILDLDKRRKIVGLEILEASKFLHVPKMLIKYLRKGAFLERLFHVWSPAGD